MSSNMVYTAEPKLGLAEIQTADPPPMQLSLAENRFFCSQSSLVSAEGIIPSPSSAPARCWFKLTNKSTRKPQTDPEYPLKLGI